MRAASAARRKASRQLPAKVGTQPWIIILCGGSKPAEGRPITFRRAEPGTKWTIGRVTKINPDGYLFIELM